jgi:arylamine N-acetyltransferase
MKDLQNLQFFPILKNIPYENVSKILRLEMEANKRPRDSKTLLSDHLNFHFGGTCFSLVNLLIKSLEIEGIKAYPVKADIHRQTFPHIFAIIECEDIKYLIDPGYLINSPVELKDHTVSLNKNSPINFEIKQLGDDHYQLHTITGGIKKSRYSFHTNALKESEFRSLWVDSFDYMNAIVASRFIDDKFIYINDHFVQIRSKGNIEKYHSKEKALDYLNTYFKLDKHIIQTANDLLKEYTKK